MAVRARQAREIFQLLGSDAPHPRIQHLIESICEEQHRLQLALTETISMMNMVVETTESFNMISEGMKGKLETLMRNQNDAAPDLGSVTK